MQIQSRHLISLNQMWNPLHHQAFEVKLHRHLEGASNVDDLYTILGNTAAHETAKMTNIT